MDQSLINMNNRFNNRLNELMGAKGQNTQILTKSTYLVTIQKVKEAKNKVTSKLPEEYQLLRRYDIVSIGEKEKLIVPIKESNLIKFYVHTEEIFQILHDVHTAIGHGGRNRMEKELSTAYKNITREIIVVYLNLCEVCKRKQNVTKKGLVVKPILNNEMNSRCQVDLIDMQSQADEQYKFILVYQDHLTKFIQLRSLKTKGVKEIANVLLDIFTIFGAPSILQSDDGREFAKNVIKELCGVWPELKMVHGKLRHSQSQCLIGRCNQDIKNKLSSWLKTNNTSKWSEGIRFVQLMKNRAHDTGINCSPYEAMFGTKLKVGLKSSIPDEALTNTNVEEDLKTLFETNDNEEDQSCSDFRLGTVQDNDIKYSSVMSSSHSSVTNEVQRSTASSYEKDLTVLAFGNQNVISSTELADDKKKVGTVDPKIKEDKEMVLSNIKKQAEKMFDTSNSKFSAGNVGDTLRIRVTDVDRASSDGSNILGIVGATDDRKLCKLDGEVSDATFPLRKYARMSFISEGQGYSRCCCKGGCKSNKCKCRKDTKLCNYKCHQSLNCSNK